MLLIGESKEDRNIARTAKRRKELHRSLLSDCSPTTSSRGEAVEYRIENFQALSKS